MDFGCDKGLDLVLHHDAMTLFSFAVMFLVTCLLLLVFRGPQRLIVFKGVALNVKQSQPVEFGVGAFRVIMFGCLYVPTLLALSKDRLSTESPEALLKVVGSQWI